MATINLSDQSTVNDASWEQLESSLRELEPGGIYYLIFDRDETHYMQTRVRTHPESGDEIYDIEWFDGEQANYYKATSSHFFSQMLKVFKSYYNDDARWKTMIDWVRKPLLDISGGN